jgi:hypothetical protein
LISLVLPVSNYFCVSALLVENRVRINVTGLSKIFDITVLHVVGFSVKVLTIFPPHFIRSGCSVISPHEIYGLLVKSCFWDERLD